LIKGKFSGLDEAESRAQGYDLNFAYDSYAVIIIKINDFSSISSRESVQKDYELSTFIIKNVFEELSQDAFDSYDTEDDDMIAYIINFKMDELGSYSEYSNTLEDILVETYDNVKEKMGIDFTSIVSNSHETLLGISDAYRECLDALAYTKILGNTKIIFYQETLQSKAIYNYSIEKEQKIINFIKAADIENARNFINDIIAGHRQNKHLSPASVQFLYYDILGTIMKTLTKSKEQELVEKLQPLKSLLKCNQFEKMDLILNEFLSSVCEAKKEDKDISCMVLLDEVREFINENLFNPDLNVAMVGDAFNITPAYLSKMFKNETGESILQIINRLRIEKSKELLKDTALSLNEISEKIGYLYPNTFIRIFKKFEGFTPGQFRKTS
jgi:YesN/AraC family two-component response regulator